MLKSCRVVSCLLLLFLRRLVSCAPVNRGRTGNLMGSAFPSCMLARVHEPQSVRSRSVSVRPASPSFHAQIQEVELGEPHVHYRRSEPSAEQTAKGSSFIL